MDLLVTRALSTISGKVHNIEGLVVPGMWSKAPHTSQQRFRCSRILFAELLNQLSYNPILPYTCQNRLGLRGTHDPENVSSLAQPHTHIASRDFVTTVPTLTLIIYDI